MPAMPETTDTTDADPSEPPNPSSHSHGFPIPPPEAFAHQKQPELFARIPNGLTAGMRPPSTPSGSSSPTVSDTESWSVSAPSTRPNSAAPSRHPSVSGDKHKPVSVTPHASTTITPSQLSSTTPTATATTQQQHSQIVQPTPRRKSVTQYSQTAPSSPAVTPAAAPAPSKPASVHSESSHKFNLKDLLGSAGPKLSRRPSAASSRKSDTSGDHKSVAGESAVSSGSFTQKYGVCGKVAVGKGATSVVRLAHKWDRTQSHEKLYAVKEFRKRRKNETEREYVKKLTSEFCISSTLHHLNVVETVDLIQDEMGHWCEVMEFCPGGDLYAAIKKGGMSESEVDCCFKQMLRGVEYLHGQGVAHRDLKPENMFFDSSGNLKIGDFGASTVYRLPWETSTHMSTGLCGSEPYIAPEQFLNKPYDARCVDIWACGIVYYCLYFQELPWRAAQMSEALYAGYATACAEENKKEAGGGGGGASGAGGEKKKNLATSPNAKSSTAKPNNNNNNTTTNGTTYTNSSTASSSLTVSSSNPSHPSSHTSHSHTHSSHPTEYPTTISNLPRPSRPLLRRILEPSPRKRVSIEEIMKDGWVISIQVCGDVEKPRHVHSNARAVSAAVAYLIENGRYDDVRDVWHDHLEAEYLADSDGEWQGWEGMRTYIAFVLVVYTGLAGFVVVQLGWVGKVTALVGVVV